MRWESVTTSAQIFAHGSGRAARSLLAAVERGAFARWRWPGPMPARLVIAPQDIRTADPTLAAEIYAGFFSFDGKVVETAGRSPFEVAPPSRAWARALHGFGWLRHLRAAETALSRQNARALVADWLAHEARAPRLAFEAEVAATRVLAWITQSPLILDSVDHAFYRRFLRSLVRQVRRLRIGLGGTTDGYPRLLASIAIAAAALSMEGQLRLVRQASQRLDLELGRQILPDGGHVSRNPAVVLDVLTELLPLRQAYAARGIAPPPRLLGAIDRMMPMLRFFRHRDGAFGQFNGMGATPGGQLATVLAYDDTRGHPVQNASHSGYQRVEAGTVVALLDTGSAPPIAVSQHAHAGPLALEFSSGRSRIVINCGTSEDEGWRRVSRMTAAHSTLAVEDRSAGRFLPGRLWRRDGDLLLVGGAVGTLVERRDNADGTTIVARHDGYRASTGLVHERTLIVSADGRMVAGADRLLLERPAGGGRPFAIRFHLHPSVRASRTTGGEQILLLTADGEAWSFSASGAAPELAESVHLCDIHGRRRSHQIVLSGRSGASDTIEWAFRRIEG
jgi:uncharacterized heparinase superfamily protein